MVENDLAVGGDHIARVRRRVEVHIRLRPTRFVEKHGHQIPVHVEILVVFATALNCANAVAVVFGIGGEIAAFFLEMVCLESDGTAVEVGIFQQHASAIDKHRVGFVGMPFCEPFRHVRRHFHTVQDSLDVERSFVENLRGPTDGFLLDGLARLVEHNAEGCDENDGRKQHHPQADPDGKFFTDILNDFSHNRLKIPHFTLHTSHSTLHTPHFTLHTPHFTLHTSHYSTSSL